MYVIMALLTLFLVFVLMSGAEIEDGGKHFFDKNNTNAMRGFWCLIVVMVHIPMAYQNRIQDMIGSFAYIGVTFFFMTSAYGLKAVISRDPESIKCFWRRRFPKLLVPCLLVNLVGVLTEILKGGPVTINSFLYINGWVQWLLVCYLIFWAVTRFIGERYSDAIICLLVAAFSVTVYVFREYITVTTWCPEIFGFIWGIVLFRIKDQFVAVMKQRWVQKCIAFCLIAGVLGVGYLKSKTIPFFGDYLLKIGLGVAIISFILALNVKVRLGNRVSAFLGSISYEVYLIHGMVFGLVSWMLPDLESEVFISLSILITVMLSVAVQWLGKLILRRG